MEQWKDIKGYDGKYQVSNTGAVRSVNYHREKRCGLMSFCHSYKYIGVVLTKNGVKKKHFVHRLVASEFIPNPQKKPYVNHKDGDKYNNNANNLEWVTQSENCLHRTHVLKIQTFKNNSKKVKCVETGEIFDSMKRAAIAKKLDQGSISKVLNKVSGHKTVGGFHWEFCG